MWHSPPQFKQERVRFWPQDMSHTCRNLRKYAGQRAVESNCEKLKTARNKYKLPQIIVYSAFGSKRPGVRVASLRPHSVITLDAVGLRPTASSLSGLFAPLFFTSCTKDIFERLEATDVTWTPGIAFSGSALFEMDKFAKRAPPVVSEYI